MTLFSEPLTIPRDEVIATNARFRIALSAIGEASLPPGDESDPLHIRMMRTARIALEPPPAEPKGWVFEEVVGYAIGPGLPGIPPVPAELWARQYETDVADAPYHRPSNLGHTVVRVLEFLNGTPYNNRAANFLPTLRPSTVEVVQYNHPVHCDSYPWRVRVYLGQDGRLISHIEQEVDVGLVGCRFGADVR